MKVMVVDDSVLFQAWLRKEITRINSGVIIEEAFDCSEARKVFPKFKPDTVILDISLPDGSGINLIDEFREASTDMKIVMLSHAHEKEIINKCIDRGADNFFNKMNLKKFLDYMKNITAEPIN